jgi:hypothetical protein
MVRILSEDPGSGMIVRCEVEMLALRWGMNVLKGK